MVNRHELKNIMEALDVETTEKNVRRVAFEVNKRGVTLEGELSSFVQKFDVATALEPGSTVIEATDADQARHIAKENDRELRDRAAEALRETGHRDLASDIESLTVSAEVIE